MPKSSSESSSKLEFSDSEFVFGGVKFKHGINMGDGDRERDRDLGVETGIWGWRWGSGGWRWGYWGGDRDLGGGDGDMGVEKGIWRVGIFAYFAKQEGFWERVEGELVLQGNPYVVVCLCFSVDL